MNDSFEYMSMSYMERLKQRRAEHQKKMEAIPEAPSLREQIDRWYQELSDTAKTQAYTMAQFRARFGESPQKIAAALWDLGWTRKRIWKDDQPTRRYWYK